MGCRLTQNIRHTCDYNPGGIKEIYLLDQRGLLSYRFLDDGDFDACFVDDILRRVVDRKIEEDAEEFDYIRLDTIAETSFTETPEKGGYKQELQTFIRRLEAEKTAQLLTAQENKYVVAYTTYEGKAFGFGLEVGANISFSQRSGQMGESSGYQITIRQESLYPLFEINPDALKHHLLASEDNVLISTEDDKFVEVYKYKEN